jgi:hypothetical protein
VRSSIACVAHRDPGAKNAPLIERGELLRDIPFVVAEPLGLARP